MIEKRRRAAATARAAALLTLAVAGTAAAAPTPNTTERVTVGPAGAQLDQGGDVGAVSADGCLALIHEWSGTIAPGDGNGAMDAFVRDCETGAVDHVSAGPDGNVLASGIQATSMTSDGRYVAFVSHENPWASGGYLHLHDRATHTTRRVPVAGDAAGGQLWAEDVAIDPGGRYAAVISIGRLFLVDLQDSSADQVEGAYSVALNALATQVTGEGDVVFSSGDRLLPDDTNTYLDAYLYDRSSDTIALLAKRPSGETAAYTSYPSISPNGRYVAFGASFDLDSPMAAWLVDRQEGTLRRVDRTHDGAVPDGWVGSATPSDTCDVAYDTDATNILATDTNPGSDTYVWDCATGETVIAGVSDSGAQGVGYTGDAVITADGRHVAFLSYASSLVPGDTNDALDGFVRHLPAP